jgi:hypothetical protein
LVVCKSVRALTVRTAPQYTTDIENRATIIIDIFKDYKAFNQEDLLKVVDFLPPRPQGMLFQNSPMVFSPEMVVS